MPGKSRIDAPGALHHIIVRGIERRRIFENSGDRDNFLLRLEDILKETKTACYAWAQTTNIGSGCQQISYSRREAGFK